jgi:hypothetical protein
MPMPRRCGCAAVLHHGGGVTALRTDAGNQQRQVADQHAHFRQLVRPRGTDDEQAVVVAVPFLRDAQRDVLVERSRPDDQVLEFSRAGIGGATQHDHAAIGAIEERLRGVAPQVGIHGDRIGGMAVERLGRVVLRRAADIAALAVEDHRHAGMLGVDVRDHALQRRLGADRREMRDLRLEGTDQFGGCVDDRTAEREHRIGIGAQVRRKFSRLRIQADAEQGVGFPPAVAQ